MRFALNLSRHLIVRIYRPAGQWLLYGASPDRNQYQPAIRLRPPFRVVWGRYLGTLLEFPAVVDDGVAYLSNLHGQLYALSMSDGQIVWHVDMHTREEDSSPAVVGSELVAHVKAGRVLVLDRATGRVLWSQARSRVRSSPRRSSRTASTTWATGPATSTRSISRRGRSLDLPRRLQDHRQRRDRGRALYLGDYCGRVLALDRANGQLLWTASAGSPVYGTSAVAGGRVFVPSRDAGCALRLHDERAVPLARPDGRARVLGARRLAGPGLLRLLHRAAVLRLREDGSRALDARHGRRDLRSPTVIDGVVYAGTSRTGSSAPTRAPGGSCSASRTASTSRSRETPAGSCSTAGRASGPSSRKPERRRPTAGAPLTVLASLESFACNDARR